MYSDQIPINSTSKGPPAPIQNLTAMHPATTAASTKMGHRLTNKNNIPPIRGHDPIDSTPNPSQLRPRHHDLWGILIFPIIILTLAVYWPGLSGDLLLDDQANLQSIKKLTFEPTAWRDVVFNNESGPLGRPVAVASFVFNQLTSGGDTFTLKYTNLMLHLLVGLLLFWLTGRLLSKTEIRVPWLLACGIASAWLLAPIQVSTVFYTIQRMTQLAALFTAGGMLFYVFGRENLSQRPKVGIALILSAFIFWLPLGALSKETALLLPVFLLILEFSFFSPPKALKQRLFVYSPHFVFLILPALCAGLYLSMHPDYILAGYVIRDFTFSERLLTEPRILFDYLRNILAPDAPSLGVVHDDFPMSKGLLQPSTTALSILGWIFVLGVLTALSRKKKYRASAFGGLFFLAGHLLESTIFPLELYYEHRNYLPSWGIYFFTGTLLHHVSQRSEIRYLAPAGLLSLSAIYGAATMQRTQIWASPTILLYSLALAHPKSVRINNAMANHHMRSGQLDKALEYLDLAQRIAPKNALTPFVYPINAYCWARQAPPEAVYKGLEHRLMTLRNSPPNPTWAFSIRMLAQDVESTGCPGMDIHRLHGMLGPWSRQVSQTTDANKPRPVCASISYLFHYSGRNDLANEYLDHCLSRNPGDLEIGLLKLRFQVQDGDFSGARITVDRLVKHDTGSREDYSALIMHYHGLLKAEPRAGE